MNSKPRLRGHLHQEAFFVSLGACILLIAKSTSTISLIAVLVYSFGLLSLFGVSALYHRIHWQPKPRAVMKRLDHSAIFIVIASTFTPMCLLALDKEVGSQLLVVVWILALAGILQSVFWVRAPKWTTAIFYVGMGWIALPYVGELKNSLGLTSILLVIAGGVFYTVGAVFYAIKKPTLAPTIFGYHELFHLFTIIGAAFHFVAIYQLIT